MKDLIKTARTLTGAFMFILIMVTFFVLGVTYQRSIHDLSPFSELETPETETTTDTLEVSEENSEVVDGGSDDESDSSE